MSCSTGKLIVPLSACISTANAHDGKPYGTLVDSLAGCSKKHIGRSCV